MKLKVVNDILLGRCPQYRDDSPGTFLNTRRLPHGERIRKWGTGGRQGNANGEEQIRAPFAFIEILPLLPK